MISENNTQPAFEGTELRDEIISSLSAETLLRHYGQDMSVVKERGGEYQMRCPLPGHDDNKPSFSMNINKMFWECHGCGRSGDAFTFIAEQEGMSCTDSFTDVITVAAGIAGVVLDAYGKPSRASQAEIQAAVDEKILAPEDVRTSAAKAYATRKTLDVTKIKDLQWGAEQTHNGEYDIVVPMLSLDLSGRIIGAQRGRKRMLPGSSAGLFYIPDNVKKRGGEAYLVEGLSDYLSMLAAGYTNTIGLVSSSIKTRELTKALERFSTVHVCFDLDRHKFSNDEKGQFAGAKKAVTLAREIDKRKTEVRMYLLGKDIKFDLNDLYVAGGREKMDKFFEEHVVDMNEYASEIGAAVNPAGYTCAKAMAEHGTYAIDASKHFYWFTSPRYNNVWRQVSKGEIQEEIMTHIQRTRTDGHTVALINEAFTYLSIQSSKNAATLRGKLTGSGSDYSMATKEDIKICLKDGFFFPFREEKHVAYTPDDFVYSPINISYEEIRIGKSRMRAGDFHFMRFLRDIFKGDDDIDERIKFIRQWIGYSVVPANPYEKFLFIIGGGGNGKSTLLETMGSIIGQDNFVNIDIAKIAKDRFAASGLLGKYMNLCTEGEKKTILNDETFKKLTGGDVITAEAKFESQFQFAPFCKFIIATNDEPAAAENAPWLQRRLQMISFNNKFTDGNRDTTLKLRLKKEKLKIFLWALDGLKDLVENDGFNVPPSALATTSKFLESSDYTQNFIDYKNSAHGRMSESNVYKVYDIFVEYMTLFEGRHRAYVPQKKTFVKEMCKKGYVFSVDAISGVPHLVAPNRTPSDVDDFFKE